jgi:anti-sigma factor RsiW
VTCRELVDFLGEFLAGELPEAERAEFEKHLAACPECLAYLDSYQKTVQLGKAAFANPEDEVPDKVPEDLVRAILASRAKKGETPERG